METKKQILPYLITGDEASQLEKFANPFNEFSSQRLNTVIKIQAFGIYFKNKIKESINLENMISDFKETELLKKLNLKLEFDNGTDTKVLEKNLLIPQEDFWGMVKYKNDYQAERLAEKLLGRRLSQAEQVSLSWCIHELTDEVAVFLFKEFAEYIAFYFNKEGAFKVVPQTNPNTQMVEYLCFLEL